MRWFKAHPNWAIFIVWLIAIGFFNLMIRLPFDANSGIWYLIGAVAIAMVWGVLVWSLRVKNRSLFNLFYLLIPCVGIFIVWAMSNKSGGKVEAVPTDGEEIKLDRRNQMDKINIICSRCGQWFQDIQGCREHIGHCGNAGKDDPISFLPTKDSKLSSAQWRELMDIVNSQGMSSEGSEVGVKSKMASEPKREIETEAPKGRTLQSSKAKRLLLSFGFLIGCIVSVFLVASWQAQYNQNGYQLSGLVYLIPCALALVSVVCFAWAKSRLIPLLVYVACMFWMLFLGGGIYMLIFLMSAVASFFILLWSKSRGKTAEETVERAEAKARIAVSQMGTGLFCPKCNSGNVKIVGLGLKAKCLCRDCGKIFALKRSSKND